MKIFAIAALFAGSALTAPAFADSHGHHERGQRADANGDKVLTLAEANAHAASRFAAMDLDGSGALTLGEMRSAHEAMRAERMERRSAKMEERRAIRAERMAQMTDEQRATAKARMERRAERMEMRGEHRAERASERFAMMDANDDGQLTRAEFLAAHAATFARRDKNDDGQITADERRQRGERRARRGTRG